MNVRFATIDDAPAIASVHVEAWRHAYAGVLPQATLDGLSVDARARMWSQAIAARAAGCLRLTPDAGQRGITVGGTPVNEGDKPPL